MPKPTTLFVGLDVHEDFITVTHAGAHRPRCTRSIALQAGPWGKVYFLTTEPRFGC